MSEDGGAAVALRHGVGDEGIGGGSGEGWRGEEEGEGFVEFVGGGETAGGALPCVGDEGAVVVAVEFDEIGGHGVGAVEHEAAVGEEETLDGGGGDVALGGAVELLGRVEGLG